MSDPTLTPHQATAMGQALAFAAGETEHRLALLTGPAGVGKTVVVAELVRRLAKTRRLAVAAMTHKACAVLSATIGAGGLVKVVTLHSLLGLRLVERDDGTSRCEPEGDATLDRFDVVVVDEASMIDREFFDKAAAIAVNSGARILFVGDDAQLPPVRDSQTSPIFGLPLRIELVEIVRQAQGSPIISLASAIRRWIAVDHWPTAADLVDAIPATPEPLKPIAVTEGDGLVVRRFAELSMRAGYSTRIVAFTNLAVLAHNEALHLAMHGPDALAFVAGEIVMAHREFSARPVGGGALERVRNSAELVVEHVCAERHPEHSEVDAVRLVLRQSSGELVQCWAPVDEMAFAAEITANRKRCGEMFDRAKTMPKPEADRLHVQRTRLASSTTARTQAFAVVRHTYASTVHRLQGSTVDVVIVDLHNLARMRSAAFFSRALYVAITRASHAVSIIAPSLPPAPPVLAAGGSAGVPPPPCPPGLAVAGQLADDASIERSPS